LRARQVASTGALIEGVDLFRYVPRLPASSPPACGLVVRIRARDGGQDVVYGFGEAVVPWRHAPVAWKRLVGTAPELVGTELPGTVDPAGPLAGLGGWRSAHRFTRGPGRAVTLALEMALLDLLMRTDGRTLGSVWGAPDWSRSAPPQPVLPLPAVPPGSPRDTLTPRLREDPGTSWAVKLLASRDPDTDLAWLRCASEVERAAGRTRPLWLVGGDLAPRAARELVRRAAELVDAGEIEGQVILEEPLRARRDYGLSNGRRHTVLAELQLLADRALKRGDDGDNGRHVVVVAGASVNRVAQVRKLCRGHPVGGLALSTATWRTLAGIRQAAMVAKRIAPGTLVLLVGGDGSGLSASAQAAVVAATPEIDLHLPAAAPAWLGLVLERGNGGPGTDGCAGLIPGADLAELASYVDRAFQAPRTEPPRDLPVPNAFPGQQAAVGSWDARATATLEAELLRSGLSTRRVSPRLLLAARPGWHSAIAFDRARSSVAGAAACAITGHKEVTRDVLGAAGLPVPQGAYFPASEAGAAYAAGIELGFPLVVKPGGGTKGIGVTTRISSPEALEQAIEVVATSKYARSGLVIERHVTGGDYRILVTTAKALSVVRREPASVVGDGSHTIEELVLHANAIRRQNPSLGRIPTPLDRRADEPLRRQGLTRTSVPGAGQRVQLSVVANLSQGGVSHEVLDATHPTLLDLAVSAVRAIPGLPYAGLDILMEDHRLPVDAQSLAIVEMNSVPMLGLHHYPMFGPPRNVSAELVDYLTSGPSPGGAAPALPAVEPDVPFRVRPDAPPASHRAARVRRAGTDLIASAALLRNWVVRRDAAAVAVADAILTAETASPSGCAGWRGGG
jgi:D-alanine-D-alanine ligase-like ATP-grasp enzyme